MNEKVKTAMERLEQGLETLLSTEEWRKFLQFQAAFHHYSFSNTLLIMCQKPDATYVAGYNRWKELGRYVKKGEHGIEIFAPLLKKKSNKADIPREESDETPQEKENKLILYGYRIVYVFDVSQTDGKPLPTVESPKIISGDSDLYEKLLQVCPYPVSEVVSLGSARGEFDLGTNQIRIVQTLPEAHKAKTLIHEWAHGLLHTNGPLNPAHKPLIELEAESTAFVVSHALGLDTTDYSFAYIAGWRGKEAVDALKACGTRIQQAANSILMALEDQAQDFKTAM